MIKLEICAQSIESALIAEDAAADRIELCAALELGGVTPSPALIRETLRRLTIPTCILVRPRAGNFVYSKAEFEIIKNDIIFCRDNGAAAVVVGVLTDENELHIDRMSELVALAGSMQIVCHRAFDRTPNVSKSLDALIKMGFHRVLTSGGKENVVEGQANLKQLVVQAADQITILAGGGVTSAKVAALLEATNLTEVHASAKHFLEKKACWETDAVEVKKLIEQLKIE